MSFIRMLYVQTLSRQPNAMQVRPKPKPQLPSITFQEVETKEKQKPPSPTHSLIVPPNRRPQPPHPPPPPRRLLALSIIPPIMPQLRRNPRPHRRTPQTTLPVRPPLILPNLIRALHAIIPTMHRCRPQPMVPAIPARSRDHRRRRVPARVADDSFPGPCAAVVVVAVGEALVGGGPGVHCCGLHVYLRAGRAVEVPDVHAAVV